jgi:hypothetical protein
MGMSPALGWVYPAIGLQACAADNLFSIVAGPHAAAGLSDDLALTTAEPYPATPSDSGLVAVLQD